MQRGAPCASAAWSLGTAKSVGRVERSAGARSTHVDNNCVRSNGTQLRLAVAVDLRGKQRHFARPTEPAAEIFDNLGRRLAASNSVHGFLYHTRMSRRRQEPLIATRRPAEACTNRASVAPHKRLPAKETSGDRGDSNAERGRPQASKASANNHTEPQLTSPDHRMSNERSTVPSERERDISATVVRRPLASLL